MTPLSPYFGPKSMEYFFAIFLGYFTTFLDTFPLKEKIQKVSIFASGPPPPPLWKISILLSLHLSVCVLSVRMLQKMSKI